MTNFDHTSEIDVRLNGQICAIRFPTDSQWLQYFRSLDQFVKPKRGGGQVTENRREAFAALQLFQQIVVDVGVTPTKGEAIRVVDSLCGEFVEAKIEAGSIVVRLRFLGSAEAVHRLRFPTPQEDRAIKATVRTIDAGRGWQRCIRDVEKLATLYDQMLIEAKGYLQSVPLGHKIAILSKTYLTAKKEAA